MIKTDANTKNKNVWIINEYAGSSRHGMEFRHYYLSKELAKLGYQVTIISATYSHLFVKFPPATKWFNFEIVDGIQYVWIKVPKYAHAHSFGRVCKWFGFTFSLFFLPQKKMSKPDVIMVSPMQTMPVLPSYYWAKRCKAKLIFEIKDIWPLTLTELGGYSKYHPFIVWLKMFERFAIKKSDAMVSVLQNYNAYLKQEGFQPRAYYIPNGVDAEEMHKAEALDETVARQIPSDKFIVGYAGTIGLANGMDYFLEAANVLRDRDEILFVMAGKGNEKEKFVQKAKEYGLRNVLFLPPVPKKQIFSLLQKFDVCVAFFLTKKLYDFGVSPNKIFDYMLAGKPVLFFVNSPGNPVEKSGCGWVIPEVSAEEVAQSVLKMSRLDKEERQKMGQRGKEYVLQNHTFQVLAARYHDVMKSL